jgi:serine/threonine-protein kinase PpkA
MKHIVLAVFIAMISPVGLAKEPLDSGDKPLLIEGKHSLYQRVLAVPDARLAAEPGGEGHTAVVPFTSFYVYARREHGGTEWIEVGTDRHGGRSGWLPAAAALEWNHGLTAAFRNPAGHDRVLLFKDRTSLRQLAQEHDTSEYETLYKQAQQEMLSPDSPVIAIQPPGFIDIQEDFYLVPIRQHEDIYLGSEQARILQVSTVPLPSGDRRSHIAALETRAYSAGLAFVIDSTLSMDPYIERTREAVKTPSATPACWAV